MDVTIVDGDVPFPANSGKRLRSLNLVLPLARRHHITYIARCATKAEGDVAAAHLAAHGIEPVMVVEPIAAKSGPMFYGRLARNLLSPLPYAVQSHHAPLMRRAAEAHAAQRPVDVWQVEWLSYIHCIEGLPGEKLLTAHNVESLIWQRYAETEGNPIMRAFVREQWRKMLGYEARVYGAVDRVITVSEQDAACAHRLYERVSTVCVENGVDTAYFRDVRPDPASKQILFLGALDWRPNLDAIRVLLEQIFPQVRAADPEATLAIVGRSPPPWLVEKAASAPGVTLHANVPDVRPYMQASAMMAVPLRIGGGSRLKIIEALAARLPVVSTAIGAEGLRLEPGRDFDLADQPAEMADAIVARLARPLAVAEATWAKVTSTYDWTILADKLEQAWFAAASKTVARAG